MKKQIKKIVGGICMIAMLTISFAGVANAATTTSCTTVSCKIQTMMSNYFSGSSGNYIFNIFKKKYPSISNPSGNTNSGNTNSGNTNSGNTNSGNTNSGNTSSGNTSSGNTSSSTAESYAKEMLTLVNEERVANGLSELKWNASLAKVAEEKAKDMVNNNYFSHTSPKYGTPFEMMKSFGISYRYAAENIARNSSVAKAHVALMNSAGHRKNILNANYTSIGIGIVKTSSNSYTVVQMFIG